MIKWLQINMDRFESMDGRFLITQVFNSFYGYHWRLEDRDKKPVSVYIDYGVRNCKAKAEELYAKDKNTK